MAVANFVRRKIELFEHVFVRLVGSPALGTDAAEQSLPKHSLERRGNEERLDAHIDQARDRTRRVVRVQGGENEMPGERSLDRDLRRLKIARFTYHDAIGVLTEEGPQYARER